MDVIIKLTCSKIPIAHEAYKTYTQDLMYCVRTIQDNGDIVVFKYPHLNIYSVEETVEKFSEKDPE